MEVRAATNRRMKNSIAHRLPAGRVANIAGSISNTSRGPAAGASPKENTAGNISTPAITATRVSSTAVVTEVLMRRVDREK